MAIAREHIAESFGEGAAQELVRLYEDAIAKLKVVANERLLRDRRALTKRAGKARNVMVEVEKILADLDQRVAAWVGAQIPDHYREGVRAAVRGLRDIGAAGPIRFDGQLHRASVELLASDLQRNLAVVTEKMRGEMRRTIRRTQLESAQDRAITREIAVGSIAAQTRKEITKEIVKTLREQVGDTIYINGRNYKVEAYAKMVARTKLREAASGGTINRMIEAGQDLVMVTAHGAKDGCGFYEGRVYSISGTHQKYPPVSALPNGGPPFHPNCLHNFAPFVEDLATATERRRGAKTDKRALNKPFKEVEKMARRRR